MKKLVHILYTPRKRRIPHNSEMCTMGCRGGDNSSSSSKSPPIDPLQILGCIWLCCIVYALGAPQKWQLALIRGNLILSMPFYLLPMLSCATGSSESVISQVSSNLILFLVNIQYSYSRAFFSLQTN